MSVRTIIEHIIVIVIMALAVGISIVAAEYIWDGYMQNRGWVSKEKLLWDYPHQLFQFERDWTYGEIEKYNQALRDGREYIKGAK